MISIDGSKYEGGGAIIRTALALSTITKKPFHVVNIRKGRKVGGLKAQHLYCIKALQQLCEAKVENVEVGSTELTFFPGEIKSGKISVDIGTAGSITLLLQSLIIPCLFAPGTVRISIIGGTDVAWSSQADYFSNVFLPHIRKYADIQFTLKKRGYYPKGGGKVDLLIKPKENVKGLNLIEQGQLIQIKGISHASMDLAKAEVAERQERSARLTIGKLCPVDIRTEYQDTLSKGSGITLWAQFSLSDEIDFENPVILGADSLGERGKKAEQVGREAAEELLKEINSKAAVDKHLADQLVPFIGLYSGKLKPSSITDHVKANIYVIEKFLSVKIKIDEYIASLIID